MTLQGGVRIRLNYQNITLHSCFSILVHLICGLKSVRLTKKNCVSQKPQIGWINHVCYFSPTKYNILYAQTKRIIVLPLVNLLLTTSDRWMNIYLNIYCGMMCTREPSFMIFVKSIKSAHRSFYTCMIAKGRPLLSNPQDV